MTSDQIYYFYLWKNQYTSMTCYGITKNLDRRRSEYQGHCGFDLDFDFIISANESIVKELESELKYYVGKLGLNYRDYEWISAEVDYATIENTVLTLLGEKPAKVIKQSR